MVELATTIWADGPASTPYEPHKHQIRSWGTWIEGIITAFTSNGGLIFSSLDLLNSRLDYDRNVMAWVISDPIVENNGIYRKVLPSGGGSWARMSDLPFSFIIASDVGAGSPNAIQATTSIPVSASALIWLNISKTNGVGPTTVQFNGTGLAYTIKTNAGNDPVPGGLAAGTIVMGVRSGNTFRLVSDQTSTAIVAAAENAASIALAAASSINIRNVATRSEIKAIDTTAASVAYLSGSSIPYKWTWGNFSDRVSLDTSEGVYIKANGIAASTGAWVLQVDGYLKPEFFGAVGDGVTDDTIAIKAMLAVGKLLLFCTSFQFDPRREYGISQRILFDAANSTLPSKNNRFVVLASNTGSVFDSAVDIRSAGFTSGRIKVRRAAGVSWPRLLNMTNCSDASIRAVFLDGVDQQVGYTGASNSTFNINLCNGVDIGPITSRRHDRVLWVQDSDDCHFGHLGFQQTLRGAQVLNLTNFTFASGNVVGGSPSEIGAAGENALVIAGNSKNGEISNFISINAGEHSFRVSGSEDLGLREIFFTNIASYNAGRTGVKCASGTIDDGGGTSAVPPIMVGLHFNGVKVEDCGRRADLDWISAGMTGDYGTSNEFGFVATNVNTLTLSNYKCRLAAAVGTGVGQRQYAGTACLRIRSSQDATFTGLDLHGAKDAGIYVQDTYRRITGVRVHGGVYVDGGVRMLNGVDINCPNSALQDLYLLNAMIKACTVGGVLLRALADAPTQPVVLDALVVNCPVGLNDSGSTFPRLYKRVTLLGTS